MFYHAVHLLNHGSALESGTLGLHGAQFCSLAGATDAGVVCTCASRTLSCPEPAIVGTTKGLHVNLPELGNKKSVQAFLAKHPNNAYLVSAPPPGQPGCVLGCSARVFVRDAGGLCGTRVHSIACFGDSDQASARGKSCQRCSRRLPRSLTSSCACLPCSITSRQSRTGIPSNAAGSTASLPQDCQGAHE